jgi:hypothetical protein
MTTSTERPYAAREGLIARHQLVFFFLLSFVFTWGYFVLFWVLQLPQKMIFLGAAGPTLSALLILAITSGKFGVLRLLRSYVHWRVGVQWYLVAVIGIAVMMFLGYAVVPGALADFVAPGWSLVALWSAVGRRWVAWFRAAPFAAATRSFGRNPYPRGALGLVAPPALRWAPCDDPPRCYFRQRRHFFRPVHDRRSRTFVVMTWIFQLWWQRAACGLGSCCL